jgi:hypothetical protein
MADFLKSNMLTGILFIVGALAPLIIYIGLGPDGAGLLNSLWTEKLGSWILLVIPISLMRVKDSMSDGDGFPLVKIGFLIVVIAYAAGMVADSMATQPNDATFQALDLAVGSIVWPAMFLGFAITGLGYYLQKEFHVAVSGIMILVSVYAFVVTGILALGDENMFILPAYLGFTLINLLLGIFTIRKS